MLLLLRCSSATTQPESVDMPGQHASGREGCRPKSASAERALGHR